MVTRTVFFRALMGTALGLTLAGCAMQAASAGSPADAVARANRAAAGSLAVPGIQLASLQPMVGMAQPQAEQAAEQPGLVTQGTVLWSRVEEPAPAPQTGPTVAEELQRLNQTVAGLKGETRQQLAQLEDRLSTRQAEQERELRTQTAQAVANVAQLAQTSVQSMAQASQESAQRWQSANQQLAQLETRLQSSIGTLQQRQAEAIRQGTEYASLTAAQAKLESQLTAIREARREARAAEARAAQLSTAQISAVSQQVAAAESASRQAEVATSTKAQAVAASLEELRTQTEAQRLKPEQVKTIAAQTVAESSPQMQAIALQSVKDSQDYIRTVARTAVQDNDPAMRKALSDAAANAIVKDDKVVFAIRKAVADELEGAMDAKAQGAGAAPGATQLGPDHDREADGSVKLDPNRLRIAKLLAPGGNLPAADAGMAALNPAAGSAPQSGNATDWSNPNASLTRSRPRAGLMNLRQYKVIVHEDNKTLEQLLSDVLARAEPFTGPWQVRWKISSDNKDILNEKFSLDAETSFEEFASYLAQYVINDRGIKLSFSLFDNERIIVVSD